MDKTVIKLEPELGRRVKMEAARQGKTMREIVSAVMLAWLTAAVPQALPQDPGAATGKARRDKAAQTLHRKKDARPWHPPHR